MNPSSYLRPAFGLAKRVKIAPPNPTPSSQCRAYRGRQPWHAEPSTTLERHRESAPDFDEFMSEAATEARGVTLPIRDDFPLPPNIETELSTLRSPRSIQLTYLHPLKRTPKHGIPTADLQLRSYSVRNLELMADICLRAAYYLNLPASGPVPLPRITERWTVPRGNFAHKKSQENFERRTMRRLIQIQDGHPETVAIWLAFCQKFAYYGVGMKANVWEFSGVGVGKEMENGAKKAEEKIRERLSMFGTRSGSAGREYIEKSIHEGVFKGTYGSMGVMGSTPT